MTYFRAALHLLVIAVLCAAVSACSTSSKRLGASSMELSTVADASVGGAWDPDMRDALSSANSALSWSEVRSRIRTITFPYDSYALDPVARAILKRNAELIRDRKDARVVIEGHCDERGTTEYNLSLGEKRATTVRDYYRRLGLSEKQVKTISYGKEQPLCLGEGDDCHRMNRRARTVVE